VSICKPMNRLSNISGQPPVIDADEPALPQARGRAIRIAMRRRYTGCQTGGQLRLDAPTG